MIRSTMLRLAVASAALQAAAAFAQTTPPPTPYTPPAAAAPADPAPAPAPSETPAPAASEAPAPADAASDEATKAVETLLTEIEDVQVVAPWTEGPRSGVWRTVMMQVKGKDEVYRFFIQQIERAGGGQRIVSTTEIKEIQTVKGAIIGYRADEPTEGETAGTTEGLTLFFDIVPSDGEIAETYELHFTKDAPYVFGPATN